MIIYKEVSPSITVNAFPLLSWVFNQTGGKSVCSPIESIDKSTEFSNRNFKELQEICWSSGQKANITKFLFNIIL